jgi:hypothetical protein
LAKEVIDAGCDDPLVYYLYYVALRAAGPRGEDGELIGPGEVWLRKALDGFRQRDYPKARTMDAALSLALLEARVTGKPSGQSKALASEAVDAMSAAILNKEYNALTSPPERKRLIHNLNYLCDKGGEAGLDTGEALQRIVDSVEAKADLATLFALDEVASRERIADHLEWEKLQRMARKALRSERFDELDFMAQELRKVKPRFKDGEWMSARFYDSLALWSKSSESEWSNRFEVVNRWVKAKPDSVAAQIVLARTYFEYGWHARGGGYAGTVTSDGWAFFLERLQQARLILENIDPAKRNDPEWYRLMLMVLADSSNMAAYNRYLKEALAQEPDYDWYYKLTALFSLPRWYGQSNDWVKVAETSAADTRLSNGDSMYARVVWHIWDAASQGQFDSNFLNENHVSWPRMKHGFRDIERRFPNSTWNLNSFCRFACVARDQQTARELFKRIGKKWDAAIWYNRSEFNMWRQWAFSPIPVTRNRHPNPVVEHFKAYGWLWLSVFFTIAAIGLAFFLGDERGAKKGSRREQKMPPPLPPTTLKN